MHPSAEGSVTRPPFMGRKATASRGSAESLALRLLALLCLVGACSTLRPPLLHHATSPARAGIGRRGRIQLVGLRALRGGGPEGADERSFKDVLRVMALSKSARIPERASGQAVGYDLYSAEDCIVEASNRRLVKTDIAVAIPLGFYGRVAPRSGLALKHCIDVGAGVIDPDYRGNVGVLLCNAGRNDFEVRQGDRIAQLVLQQCATPDVVLVKSLDDTERGEGGFGSTGT